MDSSGKKSDIEALYSELKSINSVISYKEFLLIYEALQADFQCITSGIDPKQELERFLLMVEGK